MADMVQGILEDMAPDLMSMIEHEIFTEAQVTEIIDKIREFGYKLARSVPLKHHFLSAIQHELILEEKRLERKQELNLKPAASDRAIIRKIINLFQRFTTRFKADPDAWKEFINFCVRSKSHRQLSKVITKVLQLHPTNIDMWLIARYIEEKIKSDVIQQEGLCKERWGLIWKTYKYGKSIWSLKRNMQKKAKCRRLFYVKEKAQVFYRKHLEFDLGC
ncbi:unnamed protein product [Blepharisma stoltei]|uniref:U3 small nucleolar RNA-associated protein 6 N-terminal domain-containing protein n=1 Tax=Blepharisma stoltei TaxID=1481888 RepID=A0AAU9KHN8_9CILI|nr:unnamed protein product [Blepharisma stoltei]